MKTTVILVALAVAILATTCDAVFRKDRKILVSKYGTKTRTLAEVQSTRKKLRDEAIAAIHALPAAVKTDLTKLADDALKTAYPVKTAWDYMEFFRNGNRGNYEGKLTAHRKHLGTLVVAQLIELQHNHTSHRYMDEIANGVWMIMEESTWCWPAHLGLQGTGDHLPAPDHIALDLGAGEVAKFVAWVKVLLHDQLDAVSKVINKRIDAELKSRVFESFLTHNYGWEGFGKGHWVNNWDIWINGNLLKAATLTLDDVALFDKVLNKSLHSADYFLDSYGDDGGCDEGPAYWRQAGGRLIEYLESMEHLFPDAAAYFRGLPLLHKIGQYSHHMLIERNWFVNFADSVPPITYAPSLLAKYGALFADPVLQQYSAYMLGYLTKANWFHGLDDINEWINFATMHTQIEGFKAAAPLAELVWMPDLQVVTGRTSVAAPGRLFLGAKAGNNDESHNHNDVGSFVLFQNGQPVLIDIGVGTYTAQTFNSHRYELFYMQSAYHNTPTINGVQQKEGGAYTARNVTFAELASHGGFHLTADIAGAYPATAHAKHWTRTIELDRAKSAVHLSEQYELAQWTAPQALHFITTEKMTVEKTADGLLLKHAAPAEVAIHMTVDWKVFTLHEELKSFDGDHHLTGVWGEHVKRITLTTVDSYKELKGHFQFSFTPAK